jgi:hypothetical protein
MSSKLKSTAKRFIPETLLYGALAATYCFGVIRVLGSFLQKISHEHRAEYGLLALGLMIFQGFALERATHVLCSFFLRAGKDPA